MCMTKSPSAALGTGILALALLTLTGALHAQSNVQPTNNSPNPYRTVANYFKLPDGRDWGSTSAVEIDKDGRSIWVAERCGANTCAGSNLPSILKFDASGKLVRSFGAGLLLFPHGIFVDRGRRGRRRIRCSARRRGRRAAIRSSSSVRTGSS